MKRKDNNVFLPHVLLLGLSDTAIVTANCLRTSRVGLLGLDFDANLPGFASQRIRTYLIPFPPEDEEKVIGFIQDFLKSQGKEIIIVPTSDYFVLLLSKFRYKFSQQAKWLIPEQASINRIIDRKEQFVAAHRSGLNVPEFLAGPLTKNEVLKKEWGFPVAIKPAQIVAWKVHFKEKAFIVNSEGELEEALIRINRTGAPYLIQQIIFGEVTNNYEVNSLYLPNGKLIQHTIRKLRQFPDKFGTATCIEACEHPILEKQAEKFIRENKLFGFTNLEFKFCPKSKNYYYIETNTRVWLQVNFSATLGYNFPLQYVAYLNGQAIDYHVPVGKVRRGKWVDFMPDLLFWLEYRKKYRFSLLDLVRSWIPLRSINLFSWSDPNPFFRQLKWHRRIIKVFKYF